MAPSPAARRAEPWSIRDGGNNIAGSTATLNGSGNYTSPVLNLGVGPHTITTHYNGEDTNYATANSTGFTVTVGTGGHDDQHADRELRGTDLRPGGHADRDRHVEWRYADRHRSP